MTRVDKGPSVVWGIVRHSQSSPWGDTWSLVPKADSAMWLSPLPLHGAPECPPCNLGKPLFPGPHSAEMDLGMQRSVDVCELGKREDIRQGLWGTWRRSSSSAVCFPLTPQPPTPPQHTWTPPHQEQGLFVGLICPAPLENFSINKPSFMGW